MANFLARPLLAASLAVACGHAAAAAPTNAECNARTNDTLAKLQECIQQPFLWAHLVKLQAIADANPGPDGHGNRDTGTAGYYASVLYVANLMKAAGYTVTIQPYPYHISKLAAEPTLGTATTRFQLGRDWFPASQTAAGTLTAAVQAARDHGCTASDYAGFTPGHIALADRGACAMETQVATAAKAGAAALIIANTTAPNDARASRADAGAYRARLAEQAAIPVIATISQSLARQLRATAAPLHIDIKTTRAIGTDYNLIADSPYGDPSRTVVIDAHLDSIFGAGILDNGSGSATIAEIALKLAHTQTPNRLRYIWFGGEELGLFGSRYYTTHLAPADLANIIFDLDVDVTATPNYDVLIADPGHAPNVAKFPPAVVPNSQVGNAYFTTAFTNAGIASRLAGFGNEGTDSNSFSLVGVPNTGILTNQDCCKGKGEVKIWGGFLGNYEGKIPGHNGGCVDNPHRWCDNLANNNPFVLQFASYATAAVAWDLANDTTLPARVGQKPK